MAVFSVECTPTYLTTEERPCFRGLMISLSARRTEEAIGRDYIRHPLAVVSILTEPRVTRRPLLPPCSTI